MLLIRKPQKLQSIVNVIKKASSYFRKNFRVLTLQAPIAQNSQTHSNNLSAFADKLFECV